MKKPLQLRSCVVWKNSKCDMACIPCETVELFSNKTWLKRPVYSSVVSKEGTNSLQLLWDGARGARFHIECKIHLSTMPSKVDVMSWNQTSSESWEDGKGKMTYGRPRSANYRSLILFSLNSREIKSTWENRDGTTFCFQQTGTVKRQHPNCFLIIQISSFERHNNRQMCS